MMSITFQDDKFIDAQVVCEFFNLFASWKVNSQTQKWEKILANSCAVVSAWDQDDLVGFARGISDEVRYAQVLDVLVHPHYRRRGIGKELVSRLVACPSMKVRGVILGTPNMPEFYESVGFKRVNDQAYLMVLVRDEFGEDLVQPVEE